MRLGICGWNLCGKTAVFEALTGSKKAEGDHSAARAHVGVSHVADARVDFLASAFKPDKVTYAAVEYLDLPGLIADSSAHEANARTLAEVRQTDALIAVLRAFADPTVATAFPGIDPVRDLRRLWDELVFADLEMADRRIKKLQADVTKPTAHQKDDLVEMAALKRIKPSLEEGKGIGTVHMTEHEDRLTRGFRFLTAKPILVLLNRGEEDTGKPLNWKESDFGYPVVAMFAKLEFELSQLSEPDRSEFMEAMGIGSLAAAEIIRRCYEVLNLISFLTTAGREIRAWTIPRGTTAVNAAGAVHTDMQRGFIRAEVTAFDDFKALGSFKEARAHGKLRLEGKDYIVQDGDVIEFRFSV